MLDNKKFEAIENLEIAINWLRDSADSLEDVLNNVKSAEDAGDLWEALTDGTLEQELNDVEAALDYLKDAYNVADNDLEEMI